MKSFLETWRPVVGYDGLYEVSDFGDVRSLDRWKKGYGNSTYFQEGRVLKPLKTRDGYLRVCLCKDDKRKMHRVHRLVAQAFIENPNNLPEVNHIDEVKTNNRVDNLEWCTTKYNNRYGTRIQRISEARRNDPKLSKKVLQLTLDGKIVREWASTMECGRNGFNQGNVWACCNNKYAKQGNVYKGYRWIKKEA